jgi:hypothetical protein
LPAVERTAAVVLGNVGAAADVDVRTRARDDPEPRVREHSTSVLDRIGDRWGTRAAHPPDRLRAPAPADARR